MARLPPPVLSLQSRMPPPLLTLQSRRVLAAHLLLSSAGRHPSPPLHTSPAGAPPLLRGSRVVGAVAGEEGRALRAIWWTKITTGGGGRGRRRRQSRRCRCWRRRPRTTWRAAPGARWTSGRRRTRASPTAASSTSGSSSSAPEIDPKVENDDYGNEGMEGFISELTNAIPGVDEAMSFAEMLKLVQTMDYSVVVFDTAPTGHTLRLLQFPATLEKGLEKMMDLKNRFDGLINQASRPFGHLE